MSLRCKKFVALLLFVMGVVLQLPPLLINADANPIISISNPASQDAATGNVGKIFDAISTVNSDIHDAGLLTGKDNYAGYTEDFLSGNYDSSSKVVNITINMSAYNRLTNKNRQTVMQIALEDIYNSNISRSNRNKIYNELCNLDETTANLVRQLSTDVTADFGEAYQMFKPFTGTIGIILGVLSLLIFILLGITMVLDIAYITIPVFQMFLTPEHGENPKFVSLEAYSAVKEAESKAGTQDYKSPMSVYFRTKTKQLVMIFICLLYLVSGNLYTLIASWIDYFAGFVG